MKKERDYKGIFKGVLAAFIGCLICAFNVNAIIIPNSLNSNGITGFSIILEYLTGFNYTYFYYCLAGIILITTLIILGRREAGRIIYLSLLFPSLLFLVQLIGIELVFEERILAVIIAGVVSGIGAGLCLRFGFSFGGSDTIAKILNKKIFPFVNISTVLLGVEAVFVVLTGVFLGFEVAMYSMVTQYISSKIIDYVMFGIGFELFKHEIITSKPEELSEFILTKVNRGVTISEVVGGYSKNYKQKVSCVCSPRESIQIKRYLAEIDSKAYVEVLPVATVWGVGKRFTAIED